MSELIQLLTSRGLVLIQTGQTWGYHWASEAERVREQCHGIEEWEEAEITGLRNRPGRQGHASADAAAAHALAALFEHQDQVLALFGAGEVTPCRACGQAGKYVILLAGWADDEYPRWYLPNQIVRQAFIEEADGPLSAVCFCHACMRRLEDGFRAVYAAVRAEAGQPLPPEA